MWVASILLNIHGWMNNDDDFGGDDDDDDDRITGI